MALGNLKPAVGTGIKRAHRVREQAPNPFLDPTMDGNLQQSFDLNQDYELLLPGYWETDVIRKGDNAGEETERLRGDAAEAVALLRAAAKELGIGVTIQTFDATPDDAPEGEEVVLIKYQGIVRRQYTKNAPTDE